MRRATAEMHDLLDWFPEREAPEWISTPPPMPQGWYPHEPGDPFYELNWLFLHEQPASLRRHWELAWREGRV